MEKVIFIQLSGKKENKTVAQFNKEEFEETVLLAKYAINIVLNTYNKMVDDEDDENRYLGYFDFKIIKKFFIY